MIPAAIAMLMVIPCEIGMHPFDVAEAETEICEGMLAEYSGAPLAVFKLSHCVKMYVMTALFCALFLGGLSTGIVILDIIIVIVLCTVVTFVTMTVPHAVCARFKVEQVFKFYWTVVAGLAAVSAILVWFGL
jgi:NADH-quinone oxidoreductase subunit H